MEQVLYRKYRPQKFTEIVGQEHITKTLANQVKNKRIAHAYLFTGPRGVGKTSIARILARSVNCLTPNQHEPDNTCDVCREILAGHSLDLTEIDAASHTGVDNIRELIEHLNIPPTRSRYRTFIIDEVHMLSRGAFNALLKTLEEPPAHALFILATTEIHKIPATIVSRTQVFDFKRFTHPQIFENLQKIAKELKISLSDEVLAAIAEAGDGSMRDSLVLLEKAWHLSSDNSLDEASTLKLLGFTPISYRQKFYELITSGKAQEAGEFLTDLVESGYHLEQFNKDFLNYLNHCLFDGDHQAAEIAHNFLEANRHLKISPVPQLALMVAILKSTGAMKSVANTKQNQPPQNIDTQAKANKNDSASNQPKTNDENIDMSAISGNWMEILTRVKQYNRSLVSALKLAEPVGAVNGSLTIAFPYKFHAETVNAAKNRLIIERVVEEIYGRRVDIKCTVKRDQTESATKDAPVEKPSPLVQETSQNDNLIESALEILGGEMVN